MIDFLQRLFGKTAPAPSAAPPSLPPTPAMQTSDENIAAPNEAWQTDEKFDQLYLQWLLGNHISAASPYVERTILLALDRLMQSGLSASQLLPRVPTVLLQVLKSLRDSNVSANDLAQQIAKDVLLVAELLHEVNGAYYSPVNRISSLDSAIQLLGLNGLRILIARTAFRPIIQTQSGKLTKELAPTIWEHSEKNALACQLLAQQRQLDQFHAFLAGLLYDVGLIVAFRLVDQTGVTDKLPVSAAFQTIFFKQAALLSIQVGEQWEFPKPVLQAIKDNADEHSRPSELATCLQQAEQLARLRLLVNHGILTQADALRLLEGNSGMRQCFEQLNKAQA